jgi:hypothetical protein
VVRSARTHTGGTTVVRVQATKEEPMIPGGILGVILIVILLIWLL